MHWSGTNTKLIALALLFFVLPVYSFCQTDTLLRSGQPTDSTIKPEASVHSFYAGAGYGSNMIYLGSTISSDKPFYAASLTYGYRNSFFITASASHLKEASPFMAFYSLSSSFTHTFNSWFDISADLAGYKTSDSMKDTLFSDFVYGDITTGFDWKIIYTKLSVGGLLSEDSRAFLQISNSRYFETPEFFHGKALISFDPNINILFGKLVEIEITPGVYRYGSSPPFRHYKKNPYTTIESYTYKYGLLDIEFSFPVTFSYDRFSIEAETSYILPAYTNSDYPVPRGFTFFLNAFIRIL
jgi:hypothetical protein